MAYVLDGDGRAMLVPDQFGGSPNYDGLFAAVQQPLVPPPPPMPASKVRPSQDLPLTHPMDKGALGIGDGSTPTNEIAAPLPDTTPLGAPAAMPSNAPQLQLPSLQQSPPSAGIPQNGADFTTPTPAAVQTPDERRRAQLQDTQRKLYDNSYEGKMAAAQAKQDEADSLKLDAVKQGADVATQQAIDVDTAQKANDVEQTRIRAEQQAWQSQRDQTVAQKTAALDATSKDLDSYKIDQNKYWNDSSTATHVGWYVAMALSGLGNALTGKGGDPNPAIGMLKGVADQSIRAQMDQRDQLKEKNARAEHDLDRYDAFSKNKDAQFLAAQSDAYKNLANQMTLAASKSAIPQVHINAQAATGELLAASAQKREEAIDKAANHDMQKAQLGIAGAHLTLAQQAQKQSVDQFSQTLAETKREHDLMRQDKLDEIAAQMAKAGNTKGAAQAKEVRELGVWDPRTGDPMLTPAGHAQMDKADQLDSAARRADPADAQLLRQHAQDLRDDAQVNGAVTAPDKETAQKLRPVLSASQTLIDNIQKVQDFLGNDPDITDRDGWARVSTEYGQAMSNWAKTNDMKFTNREAQAISDHIMNFDPSSLTDRALRKGPAAASLEALKNSIKGEVDATLRSDGIKDGWTPRSSSNTALPVLDGKTAVETGQDNAPSLLDRVIGRALNPVTGIDAEGPQVRAENGAPLTPTGLSPDDTAKVTGLAKKYDKASDAQRGLIVTSLVGPLTNDRESLRSGVLTLLQGENPELYRDVVRALPPMQRAQIQQLEAGRSKLPGAGLGAPP